jgi:hypothetical protein
MINDVILYILNLDFKFEAFIYEIKGNDIFAKFSDQFRLKYDGTYVTVEFRLGRTTYKRAHHAINLGVKYLGEDWLFPGEEIPCKPPRIPFLEIDEDGTKVAGNGNGAEIGSENGAKPNPEEAKGTKVTIVQDNRIFVHISKQRTYFYYTI